MIDAGLVLEGGGMRGVYTAGVLDFFMDKDLYFKNCIGVSAGAGQACSYISKQKRRAYKVMVDNVGDKRYASYENLIKTGEFFGREMHLNIIPNKLNLYDYDTFNNSEIDFYAAVTNARTGEPEYLKVNELPKDFPQIWASGSLPLLSKGEKINGELYFDGGVSDSIPIKQSKKMGYEKNVCVLTRDGLYRKEQSKSVYAVAMWYRKYPKLAQRYKNRYLEYNETIQYINELEKNNEVFVIRPSKPLDIGRFEKNPAKLKEVYKLGYLDAKALYEDLIRYLQE